MRERPILFSAPMVRAILAGTKTQTRRPLSYQPTSAPEVCRAHKDRALTRPVIAATWIKDGESHCCPCPFGVPGDRLWVREAFMHEPADYCWEASTSIPIRPAHTVYRADCIDDAKGAGWKPSIHMPRSLSRITLEVTGVRVERLQEISYEDAKAEGAEFWRNDGTLTELPPCSAHRYEFEGLWKSINGADSWNANPWVWVVSFRRLDAKEPGDEAQ